MSEVIGGVDVHEAASLFPLMLPEDFKELVADIKLNGILQPLIYRNGTLVDGRNRLRAAQKLGLSEKEIPKKNLDVESDQDVYDIVYSANFHRRNLTDQQKAAIKVAFMEKSGELDKLENEAAEIRKANRSKVAKQMHEDRKAGKPLKEPKRAGPSRVAKKVAEAAGVSPATAEKVLKLKKTNPIKFGKLKNPDKKADGRGKGARVKASMPNSPKSLAVYLMDKWDASDVKDLVDYLTVALKKAA
jgi:ParB-like nuclease domain